MSKTYIIDNRPRVEHVTREVHEHRAPTDESVRLLREMERAAESRRIASLHLDGNHMNGLVQSFSDIANARTVFMVVADINGERVALRHNSKIEDTPETAVHDLIEQLSREIAIRVVEPSMRDILPNLGRF